MGGEASKSDNTPAAKEANRDHRFDYFLMVSCTYMCVSDIK